MALIARDDGNDDIVRERCPAGTMQAVCSFVYDIGTHTKEFGGEKKNRKCLIIGWEVDKRYTTGEFAGKRFIMTKFYTNSLYEKADLRKDIESWFGAVLSEERRKKGVDLEKLVGMNCILTVVEKKQGDKTYSNVTSVGKLLDGMKPIEIETPGHVPGWVIKKREKSLEAQEAAKQATAPQEAAAEESQAENPNDDLPF